MLTLSKRHRSCATTVWLLSNRFLCACGFVPPLTNSMSMVNPEATSWTPLPPRGLSSNRVRPRERRRLLQRASQDSPMIQSKKDASRFCNGKDNSTPPVRKNRPGFNSYLKVMLDEKTMGILHEMAVQVKNQIQESTDEQGKEEEVEKTMEQDTLESPKQDGKTSKKKKVLRFKPRSRASLHMTLFFGGETICELPQNELLDWHGRVSERLEKSGFHLEDSDSNSTESTGGYSFKLVGLKVFPPQRNNLIVGILEPAPEWHVLHNDICDLAKDESRSTALAEITKRSKGKWISHITLGNLYGGTKAQAKSLDSLLEDVFQSTLPSDNDHRSNNNGCFLAWTSGIAMGGPVPKQVELDWDFQYGVSRRVASANNHEK